MQSVIVKILNRAKPKKSANTPSDVQEFCSPPGPLEVKGDQQLDTEFIEVHKAVSVCTQTVPTETEEQLLITVSNPQKKKKRIKCFKCRRWNHTRAECPGKGTDASEQSASTSPTNLSVWNRLGDQQSESESRQVNSYEDVLEIFTHGEDLED